VRFIRIGRNRLKKNQGQSLVEILVVAGLLSLMLTGIVSTVIISVNNNRKVKARTVATRLLQEGVDWVRGERDRLPWIDFEDRLLAADVFCLNSLRDGSGNLVDWYSILAPCDPTTQAVEFTTGVASTIGFKRWVEFSPNGIDSNNDNKYSMTVWIEWLEGGSPVRTSITTNLNNKPR
jgi:type II secretory pathway pseudopilin PulG